MFKCFSPLNQISKKILIESSRVTPPHFSTSVIFKQTACPGWTRKKKRIPRKGALFINFFEGNILVAVVFFTSTSQLDYCFRGTLVVDSLSSLNNYQGDSAGDAT